MTHRAAPPRPSWPAVLGRLCAAGSVLGSVFVLIAVGTLWLIGWPVP